MAEYTQEQKPLGRSRRGLVLGGVGAIVLGCCCLLTLVGGVVVLDPFNLNLIARLTGRYDATLEAMPPQTSFYTSVNLVNAQPAEINRLIGPFLAAAEEADVRDLAGAGQELDEQLSSELGITIRDDIAPWIGQYVGFGVSSLALDEFGELEQLDWVVAAESRNNEAADQFLGKFRDGVAESSGKPFSEQTYENVTIYVLETDEPMERLAFGRSGRLVIVGAGLTAVQQAIDAQKGDSLADDDAYDDLVDELPGERAMTFFINGEQFRQLSAELQRQFPSGVNPSNLSVAGFSNAVSSLSIVEAGLRIDAVAAVDPDQLSETQRQLLEVAGQPRQTDQLFPERTLVYVGGHRLDLTWAVIREAMVANTSQTDFDESMQLFEDQYGLNPDTDLFPHLDGEWAIGVVPSQGGFLNELNNLQLGFALLAGSSNTPAVLTSLDNFSQGLEEQFLVVEKTESGGVTTYNVKSDPAQDALVVYGLGPQYLFIGSDATVVEQVLGEGSSLADSQRYQNVWQQFPEGMTPVAYVDIQGLLGTIREGLTGFDLEGFNEAARFVQPITFMAVANDAGGGDVRQTTTIIFIPPAGSQQ
ncbi:MAG: DUF3352 domain-containing protein [Chloroflexi bacterium]|nr:DUF3352 domain-containing protein [Chloroflexota bacterium]MCI0580632.1 DUF3352 domain-containing protein [Chloroflexota bacterium]MCI0647644.1 DUF3352 domain-containing protein [Chloroflexota bacterium]MCI0731140.1 DUF3352 domain-containing protein [Chloroflexota bacterium]